MFVDKSTIIGTVTTHNAPVARDFKENDTITFKCNASEAFPADYAWFWSINSRTVENSRQIGERQSEFRLLLGREHHRNVLTCTVCVSSGCDSKSYIINVKCKCFSTLLPILKICHFVETW